MGKRSKRYKQALESFDLEKLHTIEEAFGIITQLPIAKFDESVDVVVKLGIDPKKTDQLVRGAVSLPRGLGKTIKVIVFAEGDKADAAEEAGADEVGSEELAKRIQDGWMDFDVAIAHPSMMGKVGRLGRVLGPQGKMPSPKGGTVTQDVEAAVKDFSAGRLEFRNDAGGNIHLPVGKVSFAAEDLRENIEAVVNMIIKTKPVAAKGQFVKRVCLSATQTPSVTVEVAA